MKQSAKKSVESLFQLGLLLIFGGIAAAVTYQLFFADGSFAGLPIFIIAFVAFLFGLILVAFSMLFTGKED